MAATLILRLTTAGLGGAPTTNEISAVPMNNIFDNVNFSEALAGSTEYRAIDIYNSGDASAIDVNIYMSSPTASPDTQLDMGATSPIGSTLSISSELIPPSGVVFSYYTSGTPLALPSIDAGSYARVWLRRVVSATAGNINNDLSTIALSFA